MVDTRTPTPRGVINKADAEFLTAQFQALREEIVVLQERGLRIQLLGLAGIPILLGVSNRQEIVPIVLCGPMIVLVFLFQVLYIQNSIMRAGQYIREYIEPRLLAEPPGWEEFLEGGQQRVVEQIARATLLAAFVFYYIGSGWLVLVLVNNRIGEKSLVGVIIVLVALAVSASVFCARAFRKSTGSRTYPVPKQIAAVGSKKG